MRRDICLQIDKLQKVAHTKPEGYLDVIKAAGIVEGNNIWLSHATYDELRRRFSPGQQTKMDLQEIVNRFFDLTVPCNFPGCEELRKQYAADNDKLPQGCSACESQAVRNKYAERVREILKSLATPS